MLRLSAVLVAFCSLGCGTARTGWTSGQLLTSSNDSVLDGGTVLEEKAVGNIVTCIALCSANEWCGSINFHRTTKNCRIYAEYVVEKEITLEQGWILLSNKKPCEQFALYDRQDWGAVSRTSNPASLNVPVSYVVVHNAGPKRKSRWPDDCGTLSNCMQTMRDIQNYDKGVKGYADISSSFYVDGTGRVYEGRGWEINPSWLSDTSTGGDSRYGKHVAISLFGTFSQEVPSTQTLLTLRAFCACAIERRLVTRRYTVLGHVDDYPISYQCPGDALLDRLHKWPAIGP